MSALDSCSSFNLHGIQVLNGLEFVGLLSPMTIVFWLFSQQLPGPAFATSSAKQI